MTKATATVELTKFLQDHCTQVTELSRDRAYIIQIELAEGADFQTRSAICNQFKEILKKELGLSNVVIIPQTNGVPKLKFFKVNNTDITLYDTI